MTFPAKVTGLGSTFGWCPQRNANMGPYEATVGGEPYLIGFWVSTPTGKLQASGSADSGHTWTPFDADNAPDTSNHLSVTQDGTTLYIVGQDDVSTSFIHVFDTSTLTWGTSLVGPAFTWGSVGGVNIMCWIHRRADGTFVIAAQTAVVATWRQCAVFYGTPGAWTGPLYLPTGTSTAHTGVHTDLLYAIAGASDRFHIFYGTGPVTTMAVNSRVFDSSNAFGTSVSLGFSVPTTSFPCGIGTTYEDSGTKIATLWGYSGSFFTRIVRVDSLTSDDVANWTFQIIDTGNQELQGSNPGAVMSEGGSKLWLWRVKRPSKIFDFTDDEGNDVWKSFTQWRPESDIDVYGMSARFLTDKIGIWYSNVPVAGNYNVYFDCLHIYQSKISRGVGTYVTEQDLGVGGAADYQVLFDSAASSGVSTAIQVQTREDTGSSWSDVLSVGSEDADGKDTAHTGPVGRFIQVTETITGGSMEAGVAGT